MKFFVAYVVIICFITLLMMAYDKKQARKGGRRIPERTLFLLSAIGGALGGIVGMRIWRHKTKHTSFVIGLPALLVVQLMAVYWFMK
ncbi:DUF1294 domain-containing protein [Cohnella sp.]|uniref:DUF1294 domain-containing protein n=1 Tax=Cohnella sp. TaxID=1883426 RepID=UPI003567F996